MRKIWEYIKNNKLFVIDVILSIALFAVLCKSVFLDSKLREQNHMLDQRLKLIEEIVSIRD